MIVELLIKDAPITRASVLNSDTPVVVTQTAFSQRWKFSPS